MNLLTFAAVVSLSVPLVALPVETNLSRPIFQCRAIGEFTTEDKDLYLNRIGGDQILEVTPKGSQKSAWEHTYHHYGFLASTGAGNDGLRPILSSHTVAPNTNLTRIDIRLDRLSVYDYPGRGRHFVLFTFVAQNSPTNSGNLTEGITFSQTYEVQEGEGAGINGYPVFNGLNIGKAGAAFKCATVNVKNESDEKALAFLRSGPVSQGLTLLSTAYPAIAPFTELTKGIGEMLLARNQNVKVQDFYLGLDFDQGAGFGARLSEGNYIVVQAPEDKFSWADWVYRDSDGKIINRRTSSAIPFNYIVFRVSNHVD